MMLTIKMNGGGGWRIDEKSGDLFFFWLFSSARPYLRFWCLEPFRVDLIAVFPIYIFFMFLFSLRPQVVCVCDLGDEGRRSLVSL